MSQFAYCPECDSRVRFSKPAALGMRVTCPECEHLLEVVRMRPLELAWADDSLARDASRFSERWRDDPIQYDFSYNITDYDGDEW